MKKRMLIIGITMAAAGSEKPFLSFAAHAIDYSRYDVDLLLAKREGDFLERIPKEIRVLDMGEMGDIFLLDRKNAYSLILIPLYEEIFTSGFTGTVAIIVTPSSSGRLKLK